MEFPRSDYADLRASDGSHSGQSKSYSVPRKPVPSQSGYRAITDLQGDLADGKQLSGFPPHEESGGGLFRTSGTDYHSGSWRSSDLPTLIDNDAGLMQTYTAHAEGQRDYLLEQCSSTGGPKTNSKTQKFGWLPNTLRWPYLWALISISLLLSATIALMTWYSAIHIGLGNETSSNVLLFGWRFSPTLIAVIYVLLETMLLVDIRRTEVFARLARNSASPAASTILHASHSWWDDPREALRRQRDGGWRSWALFWASIADIIGLLAISSLSAGLLSTENMQIARDTTFKRTAAFQKLPLVATADDATYVRSIASSTLGLTTSAWLSDKYAILPFWPSYLETTPLGSILAASPQTWHGNTTVFQVVMDCEVMWLSEAGYQPPQTLEPAPWKLDLPFYTEAYYSIQLTSADGCVYEFAISDENVAFFDVGGGWWSKTSSFSYPSADVNIEGYPTVVVAESTQCNNREIFFITTPFRNSSTRAAGHVCSSAYYQADLKTAATISSSQSTVSFDEKAFEELKVPMSLNFSIDSFEEIFLGPQWITKFQPPDKSDDKRPQIGGPLLPIAALQNWDINAMIMNASVLSQAKAAKQRFLGEALQNTFASFGPQNAQLISGQIVEVESRIVVNFAVGITLAGLLFFSAMMFIAVFYYTRLERRPLGVRRDPASAAAISALVAKDGLTRSCFEGMDGLSKELMQTSLNDTLFRLRAEELSLVENSKKSEDHAKSVKKKPVKADWRPSVLHGWSGIGALLFFAILMAGIISLFIESHRSALYETIFVYQKNFSIGKGVTADVAPYSIIPTLLAIIVKIWWSALESTFKRLQPFVAMARRNTRASEGIALSYVDSVLLWASWKAVKNRHWLLGLITLGAFLAEVFTVGMSAIWGRESGILARTIDISRPFELRTIPMVFEARPQFSAYGGNNAVLTILTQIYGSVLNGWLYGGLVEMAYNGSRPSWTSLDSDTWAFVPVDTSHLSIPEVQTIGSNSTIADTAPTGATANITVNTPGMRARLECTEIDLSNTSAWLMTLDFTDHSNWVQSTVPPGLKTGYALSATGDGYFPIDFGPYIESWNQTLTTFFVDDSRLTCCSNETAGSPGQAAIGYWSSNTVGAYDLATNFTIKWIVGTPYAQGAERVYTDRVPQTYFVWQDVPEMTALNCMPLYETVEAEVTVDIGSLAVQEYSLTTSPRNATSSWSDDWVYHQNATDTEDAPAFINVTVSYGWLFLESILSCADTAYIGITGVSEGMDYPDENLNDKTFNFRQKGLNADFMSYSVLALLKNDVEALLDPKTLYQTSNRVFATFFQHFVADNITADSGSYGFQPLNAALPSDLARILSSTGTGLASHQDHKDTSSLNSTIHASLHIQIKQLHMSPTAVYICLSILIFLAATTILVYTRHRQYFKALPRDVDSLASVLGFVYSSPKLLEWVEEHKHDKNWGIGRGEREVMARMGWFDSPMGRHWGIELAEDGEEMGMSNMTRREGEREKGKHVSETLLENRSGDMEAKALL